MNIPNIDMVALRLRQIFNPAPGVHSSQWHAADALYYLTGDEAFATAADELAATPAAPVAASAPSDPHWLDCPQSTLGGKTAREGYAANPDYAHIYAAPTTTGANAWKSLANKAVAVLNRHIVPDGISDKDALSELYGIFDGPEYRAALAAERAK